MRDRGAASLEAVACCAAAAVIVVGLIASVRPEPMAQIAEAAVCTVKTQAYCTVAAPTGGVPTTAPSTDPADNGDRRDQERGTRDDRRGRGGGDKAPDSPQTDGDPNQGQSLGEPVSGTSVTEPKPPPWEPVDPGAGEYDVSTAWPWDHAKKLAVETAANAMAALWPDASRNLLHYLANTGEPLQQDVNRILSDVPEFQAEVDGVRDGLGLKAVEEAKEAGATGPLTFPVNTSWAGYYIGPEQNANWFHALGGVQYNLTGQVTVYPPTSPGGEWRYVTSTRVNLMDQYNWDKGKSTNIGGLPITDEEMARLHQQGIAREYRNEGSSDPTTTEGTVK